MFIIHDIRHAELDAHTLLEPRSILKARENAINDAEEYVRGTEEYCKAMSRHLAYVMRNVTWENEVYISNDYLYFEKRWEYRIGLRRVPVIRGVPDSGLATENHRFIYNARNPKKATICFLDQVSFYNPRYVTLSGKCVNKIRHYVNRESTYRRDTIGRMHYDFRDVMNLACDEAEASGQYNFTFDVEAI